MYQGGPDDPNSQAKKVVFNFQQGVDGCGEILIDCYTQEQLNKTKQFQLDLFSKLFTALMESQEEENWKFDLGKCRPSKSS